MFASSVDMHGKVTHPVVRPYFDSDVKRGNSFKLKKIKKKRKLKETKTTLNIAVNMVRRNSTKSV